MASQGGPPNVDLFDSYFRRADLDRDGRISGAEAVSFFQGSGLPKPVLAEIWMHADRNKISFLGRAEFYNALKLVTVAQSGRELTPDIVNAALYGSASAKIPAPKINLAAVPALPSNAGTTSPSVQMGTISAASSFQNPGFRGPQVPPNANLNPRFVSPLENQITRPQASSGYAPVPIPGVAGQGFQGGGGNVARPSLPNSSGSLTGATSQVPYRGTVPSSFQDGFGTTVSGMTAPRPPKPSPSSGLTQFEQPAKDSKTPDVIGNGLAADSFFGDVFSASPSQSKQNSPAPTFFVSNTPLSSTNVPVSAGTQPPVNSSPRDPLQSSLTVQPGASQFQPASSVVKKNQQVPTQANSTYTSSGISPVPGNPSHPQIHWPKITQSDIQKYTKVFLEVDKDRDGKITGLEARNLFMSWRLPREVLKQVWDLSDQDNDSMLSLKEFCIALYLMERFREGLPLPAVLPSSVMSEFPTLNQPGTGYATQGQTSGWQQQQRTSGPGPQQVRPVVGARPPRPVAALPVDEEMQTKQPKPKIPILEKHLTDQLSKEEQEELNSKFREATEADKKVEELEKEILESREKIEFYRSKMQELILYKSRCDNRLNEIIERVAGDKHEVEILAKKYEAKCKQVGDVASKLTIEEATFRDIQERKMELYQAIVKMEQGGTADGVLQVRADRVQSDLDELLKTLNDRCKKYGLRAKPTALVEIPFGWQPGIQEEAADWDEDWDKFEDEGFTFVKELTLDVNNVIAPPREKSKPTRKEKVSKVESPTATAASPIADDAKAEKHPSTDDQVHENGSLPNNLNGSGDPAKESAPSSPVIASSAVESPSREFSVSHSVKTGGFDASPHAIDSLSDHGGAGSIFSGDKGYDEPAWGTFDTNDDMDSVWDFNPLTTTTNTDHEKHTNDFFYGSDSFGLNPIRIDSSPRADGGFYPQKNSFFDDSVPSTPQYTYSPRGSEQSFNNKSFSRFDSFNSTFDGGLFQPTQPRPDTFSRFDSMRSTNNDFDYGGSSATLSRFDSMRSNSEFDYGRGEPSFSRFDSMRSNNDFDHRRETFGRFDSMKSTTDFDRGHDRFQSFDDSDPFGSGPFKTSSFESQTPRKDSDHWSAF